LNPQRFGPPGLERRRAKRTSRPHPDPSISVVGAHILQVTPYGMMIESPLPLELESILRLRLIVAGEKADVEARVAACTLSARGERQRFGVGLEFTQIAPAIRERLAQILAGGPLPSD
jgi:hypothetical protein